MKSYYLKKSIFNILIISFSLLTISTFSSCKKEDNNTDTGANDNYYVKYVIKGNGAYGRFSNWTATTPQGLYTNSGYQTPSWNQTYGPVKKGFKCEVQIGSYISGAPTIEIQVSKNSEPFALKVESTGRSAIYTIN
jgi:hypothetical protein